jgi:uncharacterized protein YjbI with pentapeptide repeats
VARHLQDKPTMKYAGQRKDSDLLSATWRRVRTSRSRLLIPVIAVAGGLVLFVTHMAPELGGKCRADAGPNIDWSECRKRMLMLEHSKLDGGRFAGADLSRTDLSHSSLHNSDFTKAILLRASLAKADAVGANFSKIEGYRAELPGINAKGASFGGAEMQRANFDKAQLQDADFTKAELGRANFQKATLGNTAFATANLSRAVFQGAHMEGPVDFTNAFLFLTRIEGVDLSQATGLKQEQVDLACGNDKTVLPAGLTIPLSWPCDSE